MNEESNRRKARRGARIVGAVVAVFICLAVINLVRLGLRRQAKAPEEERVPVQVGRVEEKEIDLTVDRVGDIRPAVEVQVYPKVPGKIIEEIPVEKGDYVKQGQLVATLEDEAVLAQLEEAKAAVASARANRKQIEAKLVVIEKDRRRFEALFRQNAVPRQKLDHIDAEYTAALAGRKFAQTQIERAGAALRQIEILYRNHFIRAPVDGYVSARYVDKGALSSPMKPVLRISNEKELKVITTVPEREFPLLRKGQKAEIRMDAYPAKVFQAAVSLINPTLDPATRTVGIEIHIPNPGLEIRSGMFAHIRLFLGRKRGLVVPKEALNKLPGTGNYYVYVVEGDRAHLRNVRIGTRLSNVVELLEGVKAGEDVVTKGAGRLRDGQAVLIQLQG